MDFTTLGKAVLVFGLVLVVVGLALWLGGRLGFGSLPGDIVIRREGWTCAIPLASSIVISIMLTLLLNLLLRLWRR